MRRTILTLGGIAGVALMVTQAQAHPPGGPPPMGDGAIRAVMAMLHGGGLSDEQHDQVRSRLKTDRAAAETTIDELRAANEQLTAQLLATTAPDEATLRAALDRVATLRSTLLDQQVATALAVRGMLSADQVAAAAAAPPPDHACSAHPMP
ncbi:MAG TPA: periplasmic heavy metal sensor [Candidatus Dormibacteraeota bacterium]|nr:periplasmic heavy metal sensor [Candidatus Dormibacteraeota bacterium]